MEFPTSSSRLLVAAVHGVYTLSTKGITELFTSGSNGIAAATRTRVQDDILAIADSHVVILHNIKQGMQRTYRLRKSGPPRQLWYDKRDDRLLFTTTLENAVQVYSLRYQRLIDPATSHPSPPLLFTIHSSATLKLLLSASAKPPTVYITALDGDRKRARYLVQPHTWTAVCSAAAFHPAVGPGTDTILFVLGFTDGTIVAYSYSSNDLPVRLAYVAGAHVTTAERSPSRIPSLKRLTKESKPVHAPAASSSFPEVGDTASAVVAVGLIPGFLCLGASVGSDGCCCITDFEPDTGPEIKVRWSLYGAATALAVKKDMVAIGLVTGKVKIYSVTGEQLFSHEFNGHKIVSLEWIYEPVSPTPSVSQINDAFQTKSKYALAKDHTSVNTTSVSNSCPSSTSSMNVNDQALSRSRNQAGSSRWGSTKDIEIPTSPRFSNEGHQSSLSHLEPPDIPPRPSRTSRNTSKHRIQASREKMECTRSSPVALDGVRERYEIKQAEVASQLPKTNKPPLSQSGSICSSDHSDDYVLEWSYENPVSSKTKALGPKKTRQMLTFSDAIKGNNTTRSIPVSYSSPARVSTNPSMLAVPSRHFFRQSTTSDSTIIHPGPLKLVSPRSVDDSWLSSSKPAKQPTAPKVAVISGSDSIPARSPASMERELSEEKQMRKALPQLRNADASIPIRVRKDESVELRLTDTRSVNHSQFDFPSVLQPSSATEMLCRRCRSTVTPTASSGESLSFVTASSGKRLSLSELKAELRVEHDRVTQEVEAVMTLHEQRIRSIIETLTS